MNKQTNIGAVVTSMIVLFGFIMISFLALKPQAAGVDDKLIVLLFGSWSSLAGIAVAYWLGSSSSSKQKDDVIQTMTTTAGTTANTAGTIADTAAKN